MQQLKYKNIVWVDLKEPEREALEKLQKRFRFHDLDLEDCISERERPKIEEHSRHIFLILKFPVFNKKTGLFTTEDLKIFIGKNFIITVHRGKLKVLDEIFQNAKEKISVKKDYFREGNGKFLWILLKKLFQQIFPMFDKMSAEVRAMEKDIFEKNIVKNYLEKILKLKRNLVTMRRILLPQRGVILALEDVKTQFLSDNLELFFDDILDKIEKLIETSGVIQDLVESLREANESMLTHSLNNTIKVLTVFSAIMLPLTFISGVFGMNVPIPEQHDSSSFVLILIGMACLGILMFAFFKWRKWI